MKAVMTEVPEHILAWRRRTGADRFDETWEGVLHMTPSPSLEHQDLIGKLLIWLECHWAEPNECRVYHQVNVAEAGTWPNNYRIPDVVLITPARFSIMRDLYLDGGPDVVVEVRSPDDETYEKLPFYAKIGVREVWVVDRDTKQPEVYELAGEDYQTRQPAGDGWLQSPAIGVEFQATPDGKLAIRLADRPDMLAHLP